MAKQEQQQQAYEPIREFIQSLEVQADLDADGGDLYTTQCHVYGRMVNACVPIPGTKSEVATAWLAKAERVKHKVELENPGRQVNVFWQSKDEVLVRVTHEVEQIVKL